MYHKQEALPGRLYYQDAEDRSRSSGSGGCERKRAFGKGIYGACGKNSEHMQEQETVCILHSFPEAALELGCDSLHLPLPVLMKMEPGKRQSFRVLGASCHSVEDAVLAEKLGCTYITAGHIFDTDCKKGLPGRGLDFLKNVCAGVSVPVYAIGGISPANISKVREAGAAGACVMSGLMVCEDPEDYLQEFKRQE